MAQLERLAPGRLFAKDFRVLHPLSEGGMGAVYVVEQLSTGSQRALKLMHPHLVNDPKLRQRFEQEARVASRIESDHVVQVVAAGVEDETGTPWLAMELLRGCDLAAALAERGSMPPAEVDEIFAQLCHAIGAAHAAGVVHRDLKPENIFLAAPRREGARVSVKVLDFGIARMMEEATTALTGAIGTPLWMAPEQTSAGKSITPATDVWALGLIAFRMLTGRSFWISANGSADTMTLLREIILDALPPASARAAQLGVVHLLPPGFDAWFARCLERDFRARYPSATEARAALAPLLAPSPAPGFGASPASGFGASPPSQAASVPAFGTPAQGYGLVSVPAFGNPAQGSVPAFGAPAQGFAPGPAPALGSSAPGFAAASAPGYAPFSAGFAPGATPPPAAPLGYPVIAGRPPPGRPPGRAGSRGPGALVIVALSGVGLAGLAALVFGVRACQGHSAIATCNAGGGTATEARLAACNAACDDGSMRACVGYGDALSSRAHRRLDEAAVTYERACDAGALNGCRKLGALLERGVAKGSGSPEALYRRACDGGQLTGCTFLGAALERGRGVAPDAARAASLYQRACDGGDGLGCAYLAVMTEAGRGTRKDPAAATALGARAAGPLKRLCDAGEMAECAALGLLYQAGLGTPKDPARASASYSRACEGGEPLGCASLALAAPSPGAARDLLVSACDGGEPAACGNLGMLLLNARVAVRHGARAAAVLAECDATLGVTCSEPPRPADAGWAKDVKGGVARLSQACDGGQAEACVALGARARSGRDLEKSRERAKALLQRGCERGDPDGCRVLHALDMPFALGQAWQGSYVCAQGPTALVFHIGRVTGRRVEGVFDFHVPSGTAGAFAIAGDYDASTSFIRFDPGEWIKRPPGYFSAAFEGTVEGGHFSGRVLASTCQGFVADLAGDPR